MDLADTDALRATGIVPQCVALAARCGDPAWLSDGPVPSGAPAWTPAWTPAARRSFPSRTAGSGRRPDSASGPAARGRTAAPGRSARCVVLPARGCVCGRRRSSLGSTPRAAACGRRRARCGAGRGCPARTTRPRRADHPVSGTRRSITRTVSAVHSECAQPRGVGTPLSLSHSAILPLDAPAMARAAISRAVAASCLSSASVHPAVRGASGQCALPWHRHTGR